MTRLPRSHQLLIAAAIGCVGFLALWFVGQEASGDYELDAPTVLERLYPGSWHPIARGVLWLAMGATTFAVEHVLLRPTIESRGGRIAAATLAGVAAASFAIFAIASFANAPWSVIH